MSATLDLLTPGIRKTTVPIASGADGQPLTLPVTVVRGEKEGPTLWIDAGMHGDEIVGMAAGWKVIETLGTEGLAGAVVFVSIMNPSAFYGFARTSPVDHLDINRTFPGDPNGSYTPQLAAAYHALVREHATHYVNLHCGRTTSNVVFYALHRLTRNEAGRQAAAMAEAAGSDIVWRSQDAWLDNSLFSRLQEQGIPGIVIEAGGEARARTPYLEAVRGALINIMRHLGMLEDPARPGRVTTEVRSADFFHSPAGGIWMPLRNPGDHLRKGDVIGEVRNVFGDVTATVPCLAKEGIILSLRTYAAAPSGSSLGIVGVVQTS